MRAAVVSEPGKIAFNEGILLKVGSADALIRHTTTSVCGTGLQRLKGEWHGAGKFTVGHEPVEMIEKPALSSRDCDLPLRSGPSSASYFFSDEQYFLNLQRRR